jgi:hypothetical protein
MNENEERKAAEEYRHQRQRADARKHGFEALTADEFSRWIEEHQDLLLAIAKANGASEQEAPGFVAPSH